MAHRNSFTKMVLREMRQVEKWRILERNGASGGRMA
jgi:hypothetical protein